MAEQFSLFEEPEKESDLEKAVSEENGVKPEQRLDLNKKEQKSPYRIQRKYLNGLDYGTLRTLFYGVHQIKVPEVMCSAMNPTEILALYYGIQLFKEEKMVIKKTAFEDIVSKLVSIAIGSSGKLASCHNKSEKIYPVRQNDMKDRMAALDEKTKNIFLVSLRKPRKFSDGEYEMYEMRGRDFHDPNLDGRNKKLYVNGIMAKLKA